MAQKTVQDLLAEDSEDSDLELSFSLPVKKEVVATETPDPSKKLGKTVAELLHSDSDDSDDEWLTTPQTQTQTPAIPPTQTEAKQTAPAPVSITPSGLPNLLDLASAPPITPVVTAADIPSPQSGSTPSLTTPLQTTTPAPSASPVPKTPPKKLTPFPIKPTSPTSQASTPGLGIIPRRSKSKSVSPVPVKVEVEPVFEDDPLEWGNFVERRLLGSQDDIDPVPKRLEDANRDDLVITEGASSSTKAAVILKAEPMHAARSQLTSLDAGRLSCVAAHEYWVAVGSSKGAILLFDSEHNLKGVLQPEGPEVDRNPDGDIHAVTCLSFSRDGAAIIAGHANGAVVLWDCKDQKMLLYSPTVHPIPSGENAGQVSIVSVAFWAQTRHHAISANAAGNVQILQYSQFLSMGLRLDCQPLLDSSPRIGAIIRILPLPSPQLYPGARMQENKGLDGFGICALIGVHAFLIVSLHPQPQLLHKMQYPHIPEGQQRHPDACWIRPSGVRQDCEGWASQEPVLAVAHGSSVHLVKSIPQGNADPDKPNIKHQNMGSFHWKAPIRTLACLGESVIGIIDGNQRLSVIQLFTKARSQEEIKASQSPTRSRALSPWIITHDVINTQDVAHLAIAGLGRRTPGASSSNGTSGLGRDPLVQAAMGVVPWIGKVYIAGQSLSSYSLMRWAEILDANVQKEEWTNALATMIALFDGRLPPLLDFPPDRAYPKKEIPRLASQFVQSFLSQALTANQDPFHAGIICEVAVEACVALSAWDVLYKTVFERFKQNGLVNVYLACLEPYILHRKLSTDHLDAEVFSSLLGEYGKRLEKEEKDVMKTHELQGGLLLEDGEDRPDLFPAARRLTQLVLRLTMERLDINHAIRIYTERRLWTALVFLYIHSLRDYDSPLKVLIAETIERLKQARLMTENGQQADIGKSTLLRKVFFFIACVFEGQSFPLPGYGFTDKQPTYGVTQVLGAIFTPEDRKGDVPSESAPLVFQRLLHFSPVAFFDILARLFSSKFARHAVQRAGDAGQRLGDPPEEISLQWVLTLTERAFAACQKAVQDKTVSSNLKPLPENVEDYYYVFLATASTHANIKLQDDILPNISRCLLKRGDTKKSEILLLDLIKLHQQGWMLGPKMVQHAHTVKFYKLASWLHEQRNEYGEVLDCRVENPEGDVFAYILQVIEGNHEMNALDQNERIQDMGNAVLDRVPQLVKVNPQQFATLMINHGLAKVVDDPALHKTVAKLNDKPDLQFKFLTVLMDKHWEVVEKDWTLNDDQVIIRYVSLLCQTNPRAVLPFLLKPGHETIPLDNLLPLCVEYKVTDGAAYVLERTGDFESIVDLYKHAYTESINQMVKVFMSESVKTNSDVSKFVKRYLAMEKDLQRSPNRIVNDDNPSHWWDGFSEVEEVFALIHGAIEVCGRNALVMADEQREELWFEFLNDTVHLAEKYKSNATNRRGVVLAATLQQILSSVLEEGVAMFLPLQVVLRRVADQFSQCPLSVLRTPIGNLLHDLRMQEELVAASSRLSSVDVMRSFHKLHQVKGVALVGVQGETECRNYEAVYAREHTPDMPIGSPAALGRTNRPR